MGDWLPKEPSFPEGSQLRLAGTSSQSALAVPSSWINPVLFVGQVLYPSHAILFLGIARVLLHHTCVTALESSREKGPDLPVLLLPPSLLTLLRLRSLP